MEEGILTSMIGELCDHDTRIKITSHLVSPPLCPNIEHLAYPLDQTSDTFVEDGIFVATRNQIARKGGWHFN